MVEPAENFELSDYTILNTIFRSETSIVYLASHNGSGREVAVKTIRPSALTARKKSAVLREFTVMDHLRQAGVVDFVALDQTGASPALITSNSGIDLRQAAYDGLSIGDFLTIAIETGRYLGAIHRAGVVHQNITPENILWNPDTGKARIIDYSLAALRTRGKRGEKAEEIPYPSLAYISPEMTGRMNRQIDYRTDYYSLGVTFYELLTGKTPFRAKDRLEWFHFHIAKKPSPPSKIRNGIPPAIDEILLKLISKDPEDRYQSNDGMIADLRLVRTRWERGQSCDPFELGHRDIPKVFHISQKLYGRNRGKARLIDIFDSVSAGGNELALVSGYSGIGKSTLVNEIQSRVMQKNGIFISGKSNPLEKTIPFYAIVRAFRKLVGHLLAETEASLEKWKAQFLKALGVNGKVVLDVIPEMESIIGPQPEIPKLNPEEEQHRFLFTFRDFLALFRKNEIPLVIFLDDLQWSDNASFRFIKYMATDADLKYLFIIGAYRNNEVDARHPLNRMIPEVERIKTIHHIPLSPLDEGIVKQILMDSLHFSEQDAGPLGRLIFNRTNGNPFFLKEFLHALYRENKISFKNGEGQWKFDLDGIEKTRIDENIADFLSYRLKILPDRSQRILGMAACMGGDFHLGTILQLTGIRHSEAFDVIRTALQEGMIRPVEKGDAFVPGADTTDHESRLNNDSRFRFCHDQIQEAAYGLIGGEERSRAHLKIGRLMFEKTAPPRLDENTIAIVTQLNKGKSLLDNSGEKQTLAELNLRAGLRAAGSIAYQSALEYYATGLELLPETAWTTCYDLQFSLMKNASVCSYLVGNLKQAEAFSELLKENARTDLEKAEIAQMQVVQYEVMEKLGNAIETGMEGLGYLGVRQSVRPGPPAIMKELVKLWWNLRNRDVAELINLKPLTDRKQKQTMELLVEIAPLAYMTKNDNLVAWIIFKLLNITLEYGQAEASVYAYVVYGMFIQEIIGRYEKGYQFGKLALAASARFKNKKMEGRALFCYALFIHHWNHPWDSVTRYFRQAMDAAYRTGDMYYLVFSSVNVIRWNPRLDLQTFHHEQVKKYSPTINNSKYRDAKGFNAVSIQMAANLLGLTQDKFSFSDDEFDERDCLNRMIRAQNYSGVSKYYLYKMQILYLYGDARSASRFIPKAGKWMKSLMGIQWTVEYCLFSCLIRAAVYPSLSRKRKLIARVQMKRGIKKMKIRADHFSLNYQHHLNLMEAELARISNAFSTAASFYDRAVEAADKSGHRRYQALTRELAGRFYLGAGYEKFGRLYLKESYEAYAGWGAKRKLHQMDANFPFLRAAVHQPAIAAATQRDSDPTSFAGRPREAAPNDQLDLDSVIKACQSLSREMNLEKLMTVLIQLVMENTGAQRVVLALEKDGKLAVEAEGNIDQHDVTVLNSVALESYAPGLPRSVIDHTVSAQKHTLSDNATGDDRFQSDPYIRSRQVKSMVCIPIMYTGKPTGILYLENNLATAVFSPERVRLSVTISGQAAISIENARLVGKLERSEQEKSELENKLLRAKETE